LLAERSQDGESEGSIERAKPWRGRSERPATGMGSPERGDRTKNEEC
jgi:hypothetical protein